MKKMLIPILGLGLLFTFTIPAFSKEWKDKGGPKMERPQRERKMNPENKEKLKKFLQIRREMRKMEVGAIKNDEELQKLLQQIRGLQKQLKEQVDEKLADNEDYQNLKKQLDGMREEWKKNHQGKKGERKSRKEKSMNK